ncbi:hypothetical protein ACFL0Q_04175 [Thermodesulfobacteriota bacterium]
MTTSQYYYKSEKGATRKMRKKWQEQMPLPEPTGDHNQEKELKAISNIIIATPTVTERVLEDLHSVSRLSLVVSLATSE